ncbi:tRNA (carboxymethyluridine(34)-5-O)-methyltransferase ALKBH8 isoform X2 [Brachyhypopomus gauderio]
MPPNQPYAYVTYVSLEEGLNAHRLLNGQVLTCHNKNITLYLSFVEKVGGQASGLCALPPGLSVWEEFVSPEEELQLLQAVDWASHTDDVRVQKKLKHRRVKHYGYEFRYDNNNVDKDKPLPGGLPAQCDAVLHRCLSVGHITVLPDQLTVNQYQSGQGIPPHVDTHSAFEDTILSLSLGAKTVMEFRHPDGHSVAVVLPGRSLLVMKGEARYLWTHGITPRKFDVVPASKDDGSSGVVTSDPSNLTLSHRGTRTSFTFRKVRHAPCDCAYPSVCDSQRPPSLPSLPVSGRDACGLEEQYVHRVYEDISSHFSSTRHSPWPRVRHFLSSLPPAALVGDIGCGNGKYLGINPQVISVGCDRSVNLASICAERGHQVFVCDALAVPLRSASFDACLSIAVIHHFSTQDRRLAAIRELVRLLRVGGRVLICVWALEQEYKQQTSKYLKAKKNQENVESKTEEEASRIEEEVSRIEEEVSRIEEDVSRIDLNNAEQRPVRDHEDFGTDTNISNLEQLNAGKMSSNAPCSEKSDRTGQHKINIHTNRTAFASQDLLVPWHLKGDKSCSGEGAFDKVASQRLVVHRYYHVFQQGELERLCCQVQNVKIQDSYYDQGNWCVVLEKMHDL